MLTKKFFKEFFAQRRSKALYQKNNKGEKECWSSSSENGPSHIATKTRGLFDADYNKVLLSLLILQKQKQQIRNKKQISSYASKAQIKKVDKKTTHAGKQLSKSTAQLKSTGLDDNTPL